MKTKKVSFPDTLYLTSTQINYWVAASFVYHTMTELES